MAIDSASSLLSLEVILEKIAEITLQIQQGRELDDILQWAIADIRTLLQTERVLIYRFLEQQDATVAFDSVDADWPPLIGQLICDSCFDPTWVERYTQGLTTKIPAVRCEKGDRCYVQHLEGLQAHANLIVPISIHGEVWGLLIAHSGDRLQEWQPLEVQLVNHIALQLATAIQQAELRQRQQHTEKAQAAIALQTSPQPLTALVADLSGERKHKADLIQNIVQGVSAKTGEAFFQSLVHYLLQLLTMDHIFISELVAPENDRLRVIAGLSHEQPLDGAVFSLIGTPCETVVQQGFRIYLNQVQQRFPHAPLLQSFGAESYVGIPLYNSAGVVIGLIAVLSNQAIANVQFIQEVLTIFAARAASELERQQSEAKLRRYERIVSATPDCVSLIDRTYRYQVINQTYLAWNQKPHDQILGHTVSDLLGQDFFERACKPYLDRCLAGETEHIVEAWVAYADGQRRFTRATYAPYLELDGTISGVVINVHDLTHLKLAEAALRESEERFRQIATSIREVFWMADIDFAQIFYVNPAYEEVWGRSCHSLYEQPKSFMDFIHPEDRAHAVATMQQGRQIGFSHEYRLVRPDGTIRWIWERAFPVPDSTGYPYRLVGVSQDVTDRKAAETALRESQQQYQNLVENSPDIIERFDPQLRHLFVNSALTRITDIPSETFLGKTCRELGMNPTMVQEWEAAASASLKTGQKQVIEFEVPTTSGLRSFEMAIAPELSAQQTVESILCISRDTTARKAAEVALRQQMERQRLLMVIAQHIRQTLDLDHILNTAVTEVRHFLQTDRVIIYQFEPDWRGSVIAESVADGWRSVLGMEIIDTCFLATRKQYYEQGRVKTSEDIYAADFDPCYVKLLQQMQVRAKLVVPILQENHLWGLLVAQHCQSPRTWEAAEVELQQQLATQLAIAIQQAELHQQVQSLNTSLELQVQERTAQLQQALDFEALLKRITDQVRDSLDEEQILQNAVQELVLALNADCCDTAIYNSERTTTTIKYEYSQESYVSQNSVYAIHESSDPHLYIQLFRGQYCHFCLTEQNVVRPDQLRKTILACPITDDQGSLGDMWLFKPPGDVFNDQEIRLVQQVANQCAIALRQSQLYQASRAQVQELKQLNQLKDDFLSTVSHELRSPMSNIKLATQMLEISLNGLGVLNDEPNAINRYFKILRDEGQREVNLINDLLDLARLDAGADPLNLTTIELHFYIPHVIEVFTERTQQQQQHLVIQIPDDLPSFTTDLSYLSRILTELLHNACKYTPKGETITLSAQFEDKVLRICVSNSGVEIPLAECDRVFDKFYRIPNNDPWKHGGTGLGLALVKKLTEQLGGNIHVESARGQTTFVMEFKVIKSSLR